MISYNNIKYNIEYNIKKLGAWGHKGLDGMMHISFILWH